MGGAHISATEGSHMRRLHLNRLLLCVAGGLLFGGLPLQGFGQTKPQTVKFDTVDQVTLKGQYYPSDKKVEAACVILLHEIGPGKNSRQKGWKELALKLQKQGLAVLTFDFRGHGESTSVSADEFW